jgi:hypothetical protein
MDANGENPLSHPGLFSAQLFRYASRYAGYPSGLTLWHAARTFETRGLGEPGAKQTDQ